MATIREQDPELTRPAGAIAVLCYGAVADKLKLFNSITEKGLGLIGLRANNTTLFVSGAAGMWSEMFGCFCLRWACGSSSGSWMGRGRMLWSCAGLALLQRQESWGAAQLAKPPAPASDVTLAAASPSQGCPALIERLHFLLFLAVNVPHSVFSAFSLLCSDINHIFKK